MIFSRRTSSAPSHFERITRFGAICAISLLVFLSARSFYHSSDEISQLIRKEQPASSGVGLEIVTRLTHERDEWRAKALAVEEKLSNGCETDPSIAEVAAIVDSSSKITDVNVSVSRVANEIKNRNIMLYWDDTLPPDSVSTVVDKWKSVCITWKVTLFSKKTAHHYLLENFGRDIARLFLSCAVPAMRSDFFRVFWALSEGGIYSDLTFAPKREPSLLLRGESITVVQRPNGIIINGIFFAKKDCTELKLIAFEIVKAVSQRTEKNIWLATGPGAWMRAVGKNETNTMSIVDLADVNMHDMNYSNYKSSTRSTGKHWSKVQHQMDIYVSGDAEQNLILESRNKNQTNASLEEKTQKDQQGQNPK